MTSQQSKPRPSNNNQGDNPMKNVPTTNDQEKSEAMKTETVTETKKIGGDSEMETKPVNDYDTSNGMDNVANAINNAEEFKDPLEGLAERCANDVGEAFKPEILDVLAGLKKEDLAKFMSLRDKLRKENCSLRVLDKAIKDKGGDDVDDGHGVKQVNILINFVERKGVELFHNEDMKAYVDIENGERRETYNVKSKEFQRWLRGQFFQEQQSAPSNEPLQTAINTIEAKAIFQGKKREVFLRVGSLDGRIYIDLGGDDWEVVEIDTEGWRVISKPPIRFRRTAGMQELPTPKQGGSISDLKEFLNVGSHEDFVLVVAWLLAGFRGYGPYPVIVLSGEQGSAKTTFSNTLRNLIDPNKSPSRALPRENRDMFIAANNAHLMAFDNVSSLRDWMSDSLCRLSTGGSFATRQLNTDLDEVLFEATRPIILNGIEDIVNRPDLADRALFFTLEAIPEHQRRSETELLRKFKAKRPLILGALMDALVEGLNRIDDVDLPTLPRMADFAEWGVATETALWKEGTFWNAYQRNRDEVVENVVEADVVASAVISMIAVKTEWEGTATELLEMLEEEVGENIAKSKSFPKGASALSGKIRRAATFLRKLGIEIEYRKQGKAGKRMIYIRKVDVGLSGNSVVGIPSTAASAASAQPDDFDFSVDGDDGDGGNGSLVTEMDKEDKANHVSEKVIQDEQAARKAETWNQDKTNDLAAKLRAMPYGNAKGEISETPPGSHDE